MSRTLFKVVDIVPTEDTDGDSGSTGGVRGNHFPLGDILYVEHSVSFLLNSYGFGEADVSHKFMEGVVVVADFCGIWGFVLVFLQQSVGSLGIHGILVNIDRCEVACLLLNDSKNVPVKALGRNPNAVTVTLEKITRKDEHITNPLHLVPKVPAFVGVEPLHIKVGYSGHIVCRECYFLVSRLGDFYVCVCRGDFGIVLHCPIKD